MGRGIHKAMDFRVLQTPFELRWLNREFNGAREIYAKEPECIAALRAHEVRTKETSSDE